MAVFFLAPTRSMIISLAKHSFHLPSRQTSSDEIVPRLRQVSSGPSPSEVSCDSFVPGTSSIYVQTWGCAHNTSDSEYMTGQLVQHGYPICQDRSKADLWILNSCTVKNPAEDHFRNYVEEGLKQGKKVVVSGCVPQGNQKFKTVHTTVYNLEREGCSYD